MSRFDEDQWALILGGSSGFGLAAAKKLSAESMSVCVVHRDRRSAMPRIEEEFQKIRSHNHGFISFNLDALSAEGMETVINGLCARMRTQGKLRLLLHSIASGNLRPMAPSYDRAPDSSARETLLDDEDMARTIYSMGTSLMTWVQKLYAADLFANDARVLGMTSEGTEVAWQGYAAVSAAKTALESVSRSIAAEFGPHGIRCNVIQAGITDTPALRLMPGSDRMKAGAIARNPLGRLTLPEDVANVISLLCTDEAAWINGAIIRVDGGEHISATR